MSWLRNGSNCKVVVIVVAWVMDAAGHGGDREDAVML